MSLTNEMNKVARQLHEKGLMPDAEFKLFDAVDLILLEAVSEVEDEMSVKDSIMETTQGLHEAGLMSDGEYSWHLEIVNSDTVFEAQHLLEELTAFMNTNAVDKMTLSEKTVLNCQKSYLEDKLITLKGV